MTAAAGQGPDGAAILALPDADIVLWRQVPVPCEAMDELIAGTAWRSETITLFGRTHAQPRLIAWHGDPAAAYRYAGTTLQPQPWTPLLTTLRDLAAHYAGTGFNAVLLNYYRDGNDSMGMHSDDERELGAQPVIASISLGAERRMSFRHKTDPAAPRLRLILPHASLLVMRGQTQRNWKHGIARQRGPCGARLNLTFRSIRTA